MKTVAVWLMLAFSGVLGIAGDKKIPGFYEPDGLAGKPGEMDRKLTEQMETILKQCEELRQGGTRAKVFDHFQRQGGVSFLTAATFVVRTCPLIKIDVTFATAKPGSREELGTDVVTSVSKPYLGYLVID